MLDSTLNQEEIFTLNNLFYAYLDDKRYDDMKINAIAYRDKINLNKFQIDELNSIKLDVKESLVNKKYKQFVSSKDVIDTVNKYIDLNEDFQISPIINKEKY